MRRYISFLFALLLCVSALARTISKDEALQYASKFFGNVSGDKLTLAWSGTQAGKPLFYTFNKADGGFVIISAEDVTTPVLGYSYDKTFRADNMPDNVKSWFSGIEKNLSAVRKAGLIRSDKVRLEWENVGVRTKGSVSGKLLATAEWDQTGPYNDLLGFGAKGEKNSVTGCVATAMAIFMRYMQWPEKGKGFLPGYTTTTEKYNIKGYSIDGYVYDWKSMPLKDADVQKASPEAKTAIAQLMKDCGVSVYMDYTPGESGTSNLAIGRAMAKYFGYTPDNCYLKDNFEYSRWAAMLKASIDADRPVIYSGRGSAGGHQFILDGYDEQGKWHLNWGWGGQNNGYFTMDLIIPRVYTFDSDQWAYFNLIPDPTGQGGAAGPNVSLFRDGLSAPDGMPVGKEFNVTASSVRNTGEGDFNGFVSFAVVGKDGTVKKLLTDPIELSVQGATLDGTYFLKGVSHSCKLDAPLSFGDGIMLIYKLSEQDEYKLMPYDTGTTMGRLTAIPFFIDMPKTEYSVGETFVSTIKGGCEPLSSIVWYYDGVKGGGRYNVLTAGTHEVRAEITTASGNKETLVQEIVVK